MDDLSTLATELGLKLKQHGYLLTLAESCTGGMAAQAITSIAGSSAWFDRGFVTYSNQAKIEMLDVANTTLEMFGAVSEQIAAEMAAGALKHSHAQLAGSITGIAGPTGGSLEKPVGTVCFAWTGSNILLSTCTKQLSGSRTEIRQQATAFILSELVKVLA